MAESFSSYKGWLSCSWFQDEIINIDILPNTFRLSRRYAFRYVRIIIIDTSPEYKVRFSDFQCESVTSADESKSISQTTYLHKDLKKIDQVGLKTLKNCMQTVFEDGPKRDRRLWLDDLRLQALTNYVSFNNLELVKRCLYLFAGLTDDGGRIPACVYERPVPTIGKDFIVDNNLLFGPTLLDYVEASDDLETAGDLWPVVLKQIEIVLVDVNNKGLFVDPGDKWIFIDWNSDLDKQAAIQGMIIYSLKSTVCLAKKLNKEKEIEFIKETIDTMSQASRGYLWDSALNLFISGKKKQISWASQAWMILAGLFDPSQGKTILLNLFKDNEYVRPVTPYLYHYILEAMFKCDMKKEAFDLLISYWGGMIKYGADTFWEVYEPNNHYLSPYGSHLINSYCHAWSCTPSYFIRKYGK